MRAVLVILILLMIVSGAEAIEFYLVQVGVTDPITCLDHKVEAPCFHYPGYSLCPDLTCALGCIVTAMQLPPYPKGPPVKIWKMDCQDSLEGLACGIEEYEPVIKFDLKLSTE